MLELVGNDSELRAALERLLQDARVLNSYAETERRRGDKFGPATLELWASANKLDEPLRAWMPPVQDPPLFFQVGGGGVGMLPQVVSPRLLDVALERGADDAVAWLRRVLSIKAADARFCVALGGITNVDRHRLLPDVEILPFQSLEDEGMRKRVEQTFMSDPWTPWGLGAVLRLDLPQIAWIGTAEGEEPHSQRFARARTRLARLVAALAMFCRRPFAGPSWFEYLDPDIRAMDLRGLTLPRRSNLALPPTEIDISAAQTLLPLYEALPPRPRRLVDLALERLNRANRHQSAGDRALDVAIALEALLLNDQERGEINYRLKLRAALLTEASVADRLETAKRVTKFYEVRSKVVHGAKSAHEVGKDEAVVEAAQQLAIRVARRICELGEIPKWAALEMGEELGVSSAETDDVGGRR